MFIRRTKGVMRMPKRGNRAGKGRDSNSIPPLLEQGVSIILMDYVVEHQNRLLIERFGDLKGKLCYEGYYGRKKPCEFCALRQAIESGRSEVHEVKTKDGRIHEFRFIPFTDASGVTKVVEVTTDIGERKNAEEALRTANDELREMRDELIRAEKLAAIGQLASGVGHELRNPLGAIRNAVFYVRRRIAKSALPATEPKVLEFLDIIDGEVNSANKVINDLLGFSRLAKPTVSAVNIGGIIEDALKHVPMPENVELTRDVDSSLPMVMVDAEQVRQVFVNIILNAVQAMPEDGCLGIIAKSKGEFVEVEFTDTGGGIPESAINKIFDPLFTTKAKGIGLGLPMCKSTIERHGGGIGVESKEGEGTTFTVSLPTQAV